MTNNKSYKRQIIRVLGFLVLTPLVLFLLLAVLLYIPAVQDFAVRTVSKELSAATQMEVQVERVRLSFPLTLNIHDVSVVQSGDTLLTAALLKLDVALAPLFSGRADVEELRLSDIQLDTQSLIADTHIEGRLGELVAQSRGIDWTRSIVTLNDAKLKDAQFCVALADTSSPDTTASAPVAWRIVVPGVDVENVAVALSMPGDSLRAFARIGNAHLRNGDINLQYSGYSVQQFSLNNSALAVAMLRGDSSECLSQQFAAFNAHSADSVSPRFDYFVDSLSLQLDSLYFHANGTLAAQLCEASLREQQGLRISDIAATCYMDTVQISVPEFVLATPASVLTASVALPWNALRSGATDELRARVDGLISHLDVGTFSRMANATAVADYYPASALHVSADVVGNVDWMYLKQLEAAFPGMLTLNATGEVAHLMSVDSLEVGLDFDIKTGQTHQWLAQMNIADTAIALPAGATAKGMVNMNGQHVDGELALMVDPDNDYLTARFDCGLKQETYQLSVDAVRFPLSAFLPALSVKPIVARLEAQGSGFDPLHPDAQARLLAQIDSLNIGAIDLNKMKLTAGLSEQMVDVAFSANNTGIIGEGSVRGSIKDGYDLDLNAMLERLSLQQLAGAEKDIALGTTLDVNLRSDAQWTALSTKGGLRYNHFDTPRQSVMMKDIVFDFATGADTTTAHLAAGDLLMQFGTKGYLSDLSAAIEPFAEFINAGIAQLHIAHDSLKTLTPYVHVRLDAGNDNPISNIMRAMGYEIDSVSLNLLSAPELGLDGNFLVRRFQHGELLLDNIDADINHGDKGILLNGSIHNHTRKNPNKFKLDLRAYLLGSGAGADFQFKDKDGVPGFNIGCISKITQDGINTHIYPERPIIAFRNFQVNKENYVYLGRDRSFKADVRLEADDGTGFQLYGEPSDSTNDITLSLRQFNLGELSNVVPYLPQMAGLLSADIHLTDDHKTLAAMGSVMATDFRYEDAKLGDLSADVIYLPKTADEHYACAYINSNGSDVMECNGTYFNTEEGYFEGEALLNSFPLSIVNGFLQGTDILMQGTMDGALNVSGALSAPTIDGSVNFTKAHVYSHAYNFDFVMDEKPIRFEESRLTIDDFCLMSSGKEPLTLNGTLDLADLNAVNMDFQLKGKNFELINAKRRPTSVAFGKLYVDVDCSLKGDAKSIVVRGDLDVLNRTNLTYILKDTPLTVDNQLEGLVEFVDFEENERSTPEEVLPETKIDVSLGLGISDAAHFHCSLSEDGKSYVDVQGGGDLTLRMTQQGELRLLGRLTMEDGEMKYALPIIPLKTFKLEQGSYIEFTGDVMNPRLNIAAKERMKALVTEDEKQRSVAFDVGVEISKTLSDMGLGFTIEAPEDLGIQNQLATMTPAQRSKTAVSLMATGLFIAEGNMATGGLQASSALNAFLQSEIQNIAGSALKTVDINFGMENNTTTTGATTTDYSFQFSKRFFGNRFAINIGGRVSTGSEADNSAASIIDNVTLEYRLDKGATRYVQVFYDRSSFDPLEGQLSKMGGGIVLRKKTSKLGELFIFK